MANKKINELSLKSSIELTDLILVGDPSTGVSYKQTVSVLKGAIDDTFVPYTGATSSVNLNTQELTAGKNRVGPAMNLLSVGSILGATPENTDDSRLYVALELNDGGVAYFDKAIGSGTDGAGLVLRTARGTIAAAANVQTGDQLGYIDFRGLAGSNFYQSASIASYVRGAVTSDTQIGSDLRFFTSNAGGAGATEDMRIFNRQVFINSVAQISGLTYARLTVVQDESDWSVAFKARNLTNNSFGLRLIAGTSASDYSVYCTEATNTTRTWSVDGVGAAYFANSVSIGEVYTSSAALRIFSSSGTPEIHLQRGAGNSGTDYGIMDESNTFKIKSGYNGVYPNAWGVTAMEMNSAGDVIFAGTLTASNITGGTYTPTVTGVTNIGSVNADICHYTRVGNEVTVFGSVRIIVTTGGSPSEVRISLPVSSNMTATEDLTGFGLNRTVDVICELEADTVNDQALLGVTLPTTTLRIVKFSFKYTVK